MIYVEKLSLSVDINKLKNECDSLLKTVPLHEHEKQICLMHSANCQNKWYDGTGSLSKKYSHATIPSEKSFNIVNEELKGSYIEDILKNLSKMYTIHRARLMMLYPKSCYSWHRDVSKRIHIAVNTNENCRLVFEQGSFHIPADGYAYLTDTTQFHSAFNGSLTDSRLHLVTNIN